MAMPTYEEVAEKLRQIAKERSEWAGLPMLVEDFQLQLEPRYPYQFRVCKVDGTQQGQYEEVNQWWSRRLQCFVIVARRNGGKSEAYYQPIGSGVTMMLNTLGASRGWLIEAEYKAQLKLAELVGEWKFRCYSLTGTFLESSKRSGVAYLFRRLRPTIAIKDQKALCALCLHPIGYYAQTWAGCMTPTDDVIAHLVMMRGDEPKFWANANQHPVWHPSAGV